MDVKVLKSSDREMEIEVQGESHTLGNLVAKQLQSMGEVELAYYEIPHPLQPRMRIYIRTREGSRPREVLEKALSMLEEELEEVEKAFRQALGV